MKIQDGTCFGRHLKEGGLMFKLKVSSCFMFSLTKEHTRWGTVCTLPKFVCSSMYCLFCVVLCIVCVQMCTVLLPPGGYPIAFNKYIISYMQVVLKKAGASSWLG